LLFVNIFSHIKYFSILIKEFEVKNKNVLFAKNTTSKNQSAYRLKTSALKTKLKAFPSTLFGALRVIEKSRGKYELLIYLKNSENKPLRERSGM
jgi:hypothetical protein